MKKPTIEEVASYVQTRSIKIDPEAFIDFYTARGWYYGKTKIRDWRACVRTWEKREKNTPVKNSTRHSTLLHDLTDTTWAN